MAALLATAFGLIAVYAAFSVVASWINEQFAAALNWRGKMLLQGIGRLLGDDGMARKLFDHPIVVGAKPAAGRLPSYLSDRQFVLTLVDLVAGEKGAAGPNPTSQALDDMWAAVNALPAGGLKDALLVMLRDAGQSYASFMTDLATWYNDQMDRVSGWYKRRTQLVLVAIAIVLAAVFDIDTIRLTSAMWHDPMLRATVAAAGAASTQSDVVNAILSAPLPIGWDFAHLDGSGWAWIMRIVGIALSALALSLGAPFWFDLLGAVANVRNAGKLPAPTSGA